jgi:GTP-binding protein
MVQGVVLLVDAAEGVMPQTRFRAAQGAGARPAGDLRHQEDRPPRRPPGRGDERGVRPLHRAGRIRRTGRLRGRLRQRACGVAKYELADESDNLDPLFDTIIKAVPEAPASGIEPMKAQGPFNP